MADLFSDGPAWRDGYREGAAAARSAIVALCEARAEIERLHGGIMGAARQIEKHRAEIAQLRATQPQPEQEVMPHSVPGLDPADNAQPPLGGGDARAVIEAARRVLTGLDAGSSYPVAVGALRSALARYDAAAAELGEHEAGR